MKIISTCWPWSGPGGVHKLDPCETADYLTDLSADEVCIRMPAYYDLYNPEWHDKLVKHARAHNIGISLWPVVSLFYPEKQAQAIKDAIKRYDPVTRIVIDAERSWVLNYIKNLPRFLDALGRLPIPVGMGSYRRASAWPGMHWQEWWTHRVNGQFVIDFNAAQLYPIGWTRPLSWAYQFKLDVESHEVEHVKAGRPDMPYLPWMPTFTEAGWVPTPEAFDAGVQYLKTKLGDRLLGLNHWSLDKNLVDPLFQPLYQYVKVMS